MKRKNYAASILLGTMILVSGLAISAEAPENSHSIDSKMEWLTPIAVPTVKSAPFSALIKRSWIRPIGEGGPHIVRGTDRVMRNSAGQVRHEHWITATDAKREQSVLEFIEFLDPTNRTGTRCVSETHVCTIQELNVSLSSIPDAAKLPTGELQASSVEKTFNVHDDLGTVVLQDVPTIAIRDTQTHQDLDDRSAKPPMVVERQAWYSAQLKILLRLVLTSAEMGRASADVTNLKREEPNPEDFVIPRDYVLQDARPKAN